MPDELLEQPPRFPVTLEEYMPPIVLSSLFTTFHPGRGAKFLWMSKNVSNNC